MTHEERYEIAVQLLTMLGAKALEKEAVDENTLYVYDRGKGVAALLVGADGEVLYADSSISPEEHLQAFRAGVRTPKEAFAQADN